MGQASVSSATGGICGEVDRFENLCRYGHFARECREEENRYSSFFVFHCMQIAE